MGLKKFFKNSYLAVIILSLFLVIGFFVGAEKVMASYGSSIYKFFYTGIVPMPPPAILPPYEVEKRALPNSQDSYSFESGQFVRYLIKVKSNILSNRYKSQYFDFNTKQSGVDPFSSSTNQFVWQENCGKDGGCIGISSPDGNPLDFTLSWVKDGGFLIGPQGGRIRFDYKLDNLLVSIEVRDQKEVIYSGSFGGGSIPWTNFNINIPPSSYDRVVNLKFTFKNFYYYYPYTYKTYKPFSFYLDNLEIILNDAGKPLIGYIEDQLPQIGNFQAVDFFPNLYPGQDKEEGRTKYKELLPVVYKSGWVTAARDLTDKEIDKLVWNDFKLCSDYYQAWEQEKEYKGYPLPVKNQLTQIAEVSSEKPCIDFPWDTKSKLNFKNLTIPYYDENKALYIRYSFKVR